RLVAQLLRVVLAEDAVTRRHRLAQLLHRLQLAHRDQLDAGRVPASPLAGARDRLVHPQESRLHIHGISTPASRSISSVSTIGRPITLEKLPSMAVMNEPAIPWTPYAPALSSPSPEPAMNSIWPAVSRWNQTAVCTSRTASLTQTAVITRCSRPERRA